MRKNQKLFNTIAAAAESFDTFSGVPLLELLGDRRILIEHHMGVIEYTPQRIRVGMRYGEFIICGNQLDIIRMTKEQLVISGRIQMISLSEIGGCR